MPSAIDLGVFYKGTRVDVNGHGFVGDKCSKSIDQWRLIRKRHHQSSGTHRRGRSVENYIGSCLVKRSIVGGGAKDSFIEDLR